MLLTLIRKEIVSHILSLRFGVTFVLFLLLVFASMYVAANAYQQDVAEFSACGRSAGQRIAEILREKDGGEQHGRLFHWQGSMDPIPVPPLSSVARGLQPHMPVAVNTMARQSRHVARGPQTNPLADFLQIPDLVYIVSVVLSLLAILFAFDSICGEKENGQAAVHLPHW